MRKSNQVRVAGYLRHFIKNLKNNYFAMICI